MAVGKVFMRSTSSGLRSGVGSLPLRKYSKVSMANRIQRDGFLRMNCLFLLLIFSLTLLIFYYLFDGVCLFFSCSICGSSVAINGFRGAVMRAQMSVVVEDRDKSDCPNGNLYPSVVYSNGDHGSAVPHREHPCDSFSYAPLPFDRKRTGPRSCPVCYVPMGYAIASMPSSPSVSPVLKHLSYVSDDPVGRAWNGSYVFGGFPSLQQRRESYDLKESMTVHCGYG